MNKFLSLLLGIIFGFILTKSEVISWFRIQKMFHFQEPYMYLIIGTAVMTGMISVLILKKLKIKSVTKEEINFTGKKFSRGTIFGGVIFGIGWAITGACPGPIFAQVGTGEYAAIATFVGAFSGALIYNLIKEKLP